MSDGVRGAYSDVWQSAGKRSSPTSPDPMNASVNRSPSLDLEIRHD